MSGPSGRNRNRTPSPPLPPPSTAPVVAQPPAAPVSETAAASPTPAPAPPSTASPTPAVSGTSRAPAVTPPGTSASIIGGSVGGVVVLLIAVGLFAVHRLRQRRRQAQRKAATDGPLPLDSHVPSHQDIINNIYIPEDAQAVTVDANTATVLGRPSLPATPPQTPTTASPSNSSAHSSSYGGSAIRTPSNESLPAVNLTVNEPRLPSRLNEKLRPAPILTDGAASRRSSISSASGSYYTRRNSIIDSPMGRPSSVYSTLSAAQSSRSVYQMEVDRQRTLSFNRMSRFSAPRQFDLTGNFSTSVLSHPAFFEEPELADEVRETAKKLANISHPVPRSSAVYAHPSLPRGGVDGMRDRSWTLSYHRHPLDRHPLDGHPQFTQPATPAMVEAYRLHTAKRMSMPGAHRPVAMPTVDARWQMQALQAVAPAPPTPRQRPQIPWANA